MAPAEAGSSNNRVETAATMKVFRMWGVLPAGGGRSTLLGSGTSAQGSELEAAVLAEEDARAHVRAVAAAPRAPPARAGDRAVDGVGRLARLVPCGGRLRRPGKLDREQMQRLVGAAEAVRV